MGRLGVVIVGSGLIARFHANAVKHSEKLELRGFCDTFSFESAKKAAAEFGCEAWNGYDEALSAPGVDIVTVATASGMHDEAVFEAAKHGKHVISEKPLSITVERIDRMIEACEKAGVQLGCILQTRWDDKFVDAKRRIESGELGKVTYAGIRIPWWRKDEYYTQSSWHGTWNMDGGGALINQSIHMVDWLVALMPPVEEVKAFCATLAHPMETEDTVSAAIRFEGGALGGIYAATSSFPGRGKFMEITGTKGTIVFDDDKDAGAASPDSFEWDGHMKCFDAFADSVNGVAPYPIDGREARKSVSLIERVYRDAGIR